MDTSGGGATRVLKSSDGTPLMATDSAGDTVWQGPLQPFGRDWQEGPANGALSNGLFLRFPGQWEDGRWGDAASAAGMYYNVHRWYSDPIGRYIRPDPLGVQQGEDQEGQDEEQRKRPRLRDLLGRGDG